jgi:large subunit ribosomal protein L22
MSGASGLLSFFQVSNIRLFSTASAETLKSQSSMVPTLTQPALFSAGGKQFAAFQIPAFQGKLKPYIVKRRLNRMRTYIGQEKNIRHSPWRMALVCRFAAGMPLQDAINQLEFCQKKMAPLVQKVLIRTANLAEIRDGLQRSQLEVAECFATKGHHLKRIMIMGRGRHGIMHHKHCHIRVVLREIDFKLRIYQAPNMHQKKKWFLRQQEALQDAARYAQERAEIEQMEAQAAAYKAKQDATAAAK